MDISTLRQEGQELVREDGLAGAVAQEGHDDHGPRREGVGSCILDPGHRCPQPTRWTASEFWNSLLNCISRFSWINKMGLSHKMGGYTIYIYIYTHPKIVNFELEKYGRMTLKYHKP